VVVDLAPLRLLDCSEVRQLPCTAHLWCGHLMLADVSRCKQQAKNMCLPLCGWQHLAMWCVEVTHNGSTWDSNTEHCGHQ
jgi:hypothetical protein